VACLTASSAHDRRVAALEGELRHGAPEILDRFIAECLAEAERTRLLVETSISPGHANVFTGRRMPVVSTNAPSVTARLTALREAHTAAEAMKLEALSEAEIPARLTALRDGILEVEEVTRDQSWLLAPGELRQIEWHAADTAARRWSGEPAR
jgi:hypothetical protein